MQRTYAMHADAHGIRYTQRDAREAGMPDMSRRGGCERVETKLPSAEGAGPGAAPRGCACAGGKRMQSHVWNGGITAPQRCRQVMP